MIVIAKEFDNKPNTANVSIYKNVVGAELHMAMWQLLTFAIGVGHSSLTLQNSSSWKITVWL